jgi:hypothetical protein
MPCSPALHQGTEKPHTKSLDHRRLSLRGCSRWKVVLSLDDHNTVHVWCDILDGSRVVSRLVKINFFQTLKTKRRYKRLCRPVGVPRDYIVGLRVPFKLFSRT